MFIILLILADHLGNISSFILYNKFQKYITSLLLLRKLKSINAMLSKVVIPVNKEHKVDRYLPLFTFILFLFLCVSVYTHTCAPTSGGQGLTRLWVQKALLINNSSVQPFLTISDLYSIFNLLDPLCCFLGLQFLPLYLQFYELFFVLLGFLFYRQIPSFITWLILLPFLCGGSAVQQQKSHTATFQTWGPLFILHSLCEASTSWRDQWHLPYGHSKSFMNLRKSLEK